MLHSFQPILTYSEVHQVEPKKLGIQRLVDWDVCTAAEALIKLQNAFEDKGYKHCIVQSFIANLSDVYRRKLRSVMERMGVSPILMSRVTTIKILVDVVNAVNSDILRSGSRKFGRWDEIFDMILEFNELHYRESDIGFSDDTPQLVWQLMMMQSVNGYNRRQYVRTGAVKQWLFIEFLNGEFAEFEEDIMRLTGAGALRNLVLVFLALLRQIESNFRQDEPYLALPPAHPVARIIDSLELITVARLGAPLITEAHLHMSPFLKMVPEYIMLVGADAFSLVSNQGLSYYLFRKKLVKKYLPKVKSYSDWQGYLGKKYFENFLIGGLLRGLRNVGIRVIESDDIYFPDFTVIVNEKKVLLLELKSSSLHFSVWGQQKLSDFTAFLIANFCGGEKGVVQLNNSIQRMAGDPLKYGFRRTISELEIFPIIVYTEPHLSIPCVNSFVTSQAPVLEPNVKAQFKKVHPVTMIHDDFFLEHISQISKDRQYLPSLIESFWKNRKEMARKYSLANSTSNYVLANRSFEDYVYRGKKGFSMTPEEIYKAVVAVFIKKKIIGVTSEMHNGKRECRSWQWLLVNHYYYHCLLALIP